MTKSGNGWRTVAFGDVVKLNKERAQDPLSEGLDRYVGLEHLEPGDLKIRRWGNVADGITFTNVFRPGHVLFGKRRAYQRKVAVADFSGVCSGDIYVLTPKDDRLLPELLPFICQTNSFFDHAIGTSAGSLSPRTNWKSLASYEFALPPIHVQRQIGATLESAEVLYQRTTSTLPAARAVQAATVRSLFAEEWKRWPAYPISHVAAVQIGRQKSPKYTKGLRPKPYLRVGNLGEWRLDLTDVQEMDFDADDLDKYRLMPGDILLSEGDIVSPLNVGRSALFSGEIDDCCFQNHLIRVRCGDGLDPHFARAALRYMHMEREFARAAKVTTITSLGVGRLAAMNIRVPAMETQRGIAEISDAMWDLDLEIARRAEHARSVRQAILNEALVNAF